MGPDPKTSAPLLGEHDLDPDFLRAWRRGDEDLARDLASEIHPGVFELRVLSPSWCSRLLTEVEEIEARAEREGRELQRPNSMNEYGLILDQVGFEPVLRELRERWLAPLTGLFFPQCGGAELDGHHGFVVDYGRERDVDLGFHVDDSEVTLNLCLEGGDDLRGSELVFRGVRCYRHQQVPDDEEEWFEYVHEPGVLLLHAGKHRHQVEPLRRGRRRNMILWLQSSAYREHVGVPEVECPDWCPVESGRVQQRRLG